MRTIDALEQELRRWEGVTWRAEHAGRHPRLHLTGPTGKTRFLVYSHTPVERRAVLNKVSELRRVLRELVLDA